MAISLQADTPRATCGQGSRQARKGDTSRAPFSCSTKAPCPLHAQTGKPCTTSQTATSRGFAGQSIHTLIQTQHSTVQPAHSCSTYRDEGSLSEITIADYLSDSALQSSRDGVQDSLAREAASLRQQRSCYSATCTDILRDPDLQRSWSPQHSNFLERRPKVQIPSRLQGCVTEAVPDVTSADKVVLDGDVQLALWHQYAAAQQATDVTNALQSKLGRRATSSQIAAALSLPSPAALKQCLADGKSAKLRLVAANIGMVRKLAHDYKHRKEVPFQDLVQAGLWGLDRGLSKYDPNRGAKLSTALYWYIRDAIFKAYRLESRTIHIPLTTQEQMNKLHVVVQQYQLQRPGQSPSVQYVMKATGLGKLAVKRVMQVNALSECSLDGLATSQGSSGQKADNDDYTDRLMERLAGSNDEADKAHTTLLLQLDLEAQLTMLPDPMGVIVQEKYGLLDGHAKTFEEVSDMLKMKRWKVQEYHRLAIKTLQSSEHVIQLAHSF